MGLKIGLERIPELYLMLQCGDNIQIQKRNSGTPLVIQWLRLCISNAGSAGLIPSQWHETDTASEEGQFNLWSCVMPESPELSDERHQGLPWGTQGKCRYPRAALEGSHPHPQIAGSCRSPASHPCTRPSEQGPGIPTPPEWIRWPHPQRSVVSEMKPHVTKTAMKTSHFHAKDKV